GGPGAEVVDAGRVVARRSADRRLVQQGVGHADQGDQGAQADQGLQPITLLLEQQHARSRDQRQHDRRDDEMVLPVGHSPGSRPSMWSLPVMPRLVSSTTRNRAVRAKLMTMAVRTRA